MLQKRANLYKNYREMKKYFLLLIVFCPSLWGQSNEDLLPIEFNENSGIYLFFKEPTAFIPETNKTVFIDGKINFWDQGGQIVLRPSANGRIVVLPPVLNVNRTKTLGLEVSNDSLQSSTTVIRRGSTHTSQGNGSQLILNVFPNPFVTELNLHLNKENDYLIKYKMYNVYGIVEKEFEFTNQTTRSHTIDTSNMVDPYSVQVLSLYVIEVTYASLTTFGTYEIYTERRTIIKD